jgi:hypothetical protein
LKNIGALSHLNRVSDRSHHSRTILTYFYMFWQVLVYYAASGKDYSRGLYDTRYIFSSIQSISCTQPEILDLIIKKSCSTDNLNSLFWPYDKIENLLWILVRDLVKGLGLNVSTTPLRQWGFRQCLPFSWTTLRGKHCRHPIAVMGVVDTFGLGVWVQKSQFLLTFSIVHILFMLA